MTKTGRQLLGEFLEVFAVDYVFCNPGTTEATFIDVVSTQRSCKFILALHESTAVGVAAGYALKSGKPSIVNIHTYPGLANAMSNLFNAYTSGIPLVVIAGQQNRQHLVHNPILSGELTELARTATTTQVQIDHVRDMSILLQRVYLEAAESRMPTFVSIPMEIYEDSCEGGYFKPTKVLAEPAVDDLGAIARDLAVGGKVAFVADAEALWSPSVKTSLTALSATLGADVWLAPFAVRSMADVGSPRYRGCLPSVSDEANRVLAGYDTVVLLGEKIQSFLYHGLPTVPGQVHLIQFSDGNTRTRHDVPFDAVVRGNIGRNLERLAALVAAHAPAVKAPVPATGPTAAPPRSLLLDMLESLPRDTAIVIEGSSHGAIEESLVTHLRFQEVYFEPRGGALGMAMPLAIGISLHSRKPTVCLTGDGGSLFSIQALWTAARYRVPVVFVCFVNHEYRILKQLWKLQVPQSTEDQYGPVMDLKDPELDLAKIAEGFGARARRADQSNYGAVLAEAMTHDGPTFIMIPDDHRYL